MLRSCTWTPRLLTIGLALLLPLGLTTGGPAPAQDAAGDFEGIGEAEGLKSCGKPPPPKSSQVSSGEGYPPLPLPATPQRRSEKKLPPTPPTLITKIKSGSRLDWDTDPNDVNNLLTWMKANLDVSFGYEKKKLSEINLESGNVPVLYRTGHHAFEFSPQQRKRLRDYLLSGGMIIFDACCGREAFQKSAEREIKKIFPEEELKTLGADHPIYNAYYENTGVVKFTEATLSNHPDMSAEGLARLKGIEIGCRLQVVYSPHDLSCGWDMHTHDTPGGSWIHFKDALKLGANFMAYATATRNLSTNLAEAKAYKDADPHKADKFQVGQIKHEGDWNPDPTGLRNLLDVVAKETALKVSFETVPIEPTFKNLSRFPFVYITGHGDFEWSKQEVAAIRQYLNNGGFILGEACGGRQAFDHAFRREMRKVLKSGKLNTLPTEHPVYSIQHNIDQVRYTKAAHFRAGEVQRKPQLLGTGIDGRLGVIYSPIGMNIGWRLKDVPYAVAYESKSALQLGTNIVLYALTQ